MEWCDVLWVEMGTDEELPGALAEVEAHMDYFGVYKTEALLEEGGQESVQDVSTQT